MFDLLLSIGTMIHTGHYELPMEKKGSVKWRCEHAQSRGFLGNFVNLHNATS